MDQPNILLIMTDEERYPPPYEVDSVRAFRNSQLTARESIRSRGLEFHRHYAGSTACMPSRATLFTGQYPSLHGVNSDGRHGQAELPTRACGGWTQTRCRRWATGSGPAATRPTTGASGTSRFADLMIPGTHEGLMASDDDGRPIADAVAAYTQGRPARPVRLLRVDRP